MKVTLTPYTCQAPYHNHANNSPNLKSQGDCVKFNVVLAELIKVLN